MARDLLGSYARELGEEPQVLATCTGADLVGRRYHPIFDYFDDAAHRAEGAAPGPKAWTIIAADFVTTSDGTGLVHMASAFGKDDMIQGNLSFQEALDHLATEWRNHSTRQRSQVLRRPRADSPLLWKVISRVNKNPLGKDMEFFIENKNTGVLRFIFLLLISIVIHCF